MTSHITSHVHKLPSRDILICVVFYKETRLSKKLFWGSGRITVCIYCVYLKSEWIASGSHMDDHNWVTNKVLKLEVYI